MEAATGEAVAAAPAALPHRVGEPAAATSSGRMGGEPGLPLPQMGLRSPAAPGGGRLGNAEGNALLAAIRREIEASEERFGTRMSRLERQTELLRPTTEKVARLDERLLAVETSRLEHDRRLAEMGGSLTGFASELQLLVKRVANMDARFGALQCGHDETGRLSVEELRHDLASTAHGMTLLREDMLKRVDDKMNKFQALADGFAESQICHGRRLDLAEAQLEMLVESHERLHCLGSDGAHPECGGFRSPDGPAGGGAGRPSAAFAPGPALPTPEVVQMERAAMEARQAAEQAAETSKDLTREIHYLQVRVEEHELRISALASKAQTQGTQLRELGECVAQVAEQLAEPADEQLGEASEEVTGREMPSLQDGGRVEENPVDRRITALEEKLAVRGRKGGTAASPQEPHGRPRDVPEQEDGEGPAPHLVASTTAGAGVLRELRAELSGLAGQVATQGQQLEELRAAAAAVPRRGSGKPTAGDSSGTVSAEVAGGASPTVAHGGVQGATFALAVEVRALTECLASSEAATRALAPRLLAAAALAGEAGDLRLSEVGGVSKEKKATREAKGRSGSGQGCWPWWS